MKIPRHTFSVLAALLMAATFAPASAAPQDASSSCTKTETGYSCLYGPVSVPAGEMVKLQEGMAAPPEAGYVTSVRATLVDPGGQPIAHHMVHLHHAVLLNPNKGDTTCSSYGGFPNFDRFFASGKERTKFQLPGGYGYYWDDQPNSFSATPFWYLVAHLDGMHGQDDVYIRFDLGFTPEAEATDFVDVDPIWLDVRNCTLDPVFDVTKGSGRYGRFKETWTYTMPEGGNFISMAGHLHDGGLRLVLRNTTTGAEVFTSVATYGDRYDPWYLTKMSSFSELPGIPVASGDELKLTAVYDSKHRWNDVMGIMLGALVPTP